MPDTPIDLEKLRSIAYLGGGRTRDQVREYDRGDGVKVKATTDQLGNVTTEHAVGDRVDVTINAPLIKVSTQTQEVRT